jgi:protein-S-isoprenylcysteine O-methyltransferase Ste14
MKPDVLVALVIAAATLLSFGAAMTWFKKANARTPAKVLLMLSALACAALQLLAIARSPHVAPACRAAGVALYVLAHVVFWWSRAAHGGKRPAFALVNVKPSFLTQTGPYRLIRHPIYTAYLLAWLAGPVIAARPWLLLTTAWMTAFHFVAARLEERSFADSPLAREYAQYRRRTGMFLPSPAAVRQLFTKA